MHHGAEAFEAERLAALHRSELLDSAPEPEFDELVEIAAAICGAPKSVVSLVADERQWFKATFGVDAKETARDISFCQYTIAQDDVFTVEDTHIDPRFRDNPLVTGELDLRFYAGFPVSTPDGFHLGSLCVFDHIPRQLNEAQRQALRTLARQVNARIELRMQRRTLERALHIAEEAQARLESSDRRFKAFMNSGPFVAVMKDFDGRLIYYNQAFADHFHITSTDWIGYRNSDRFSPELAAAVAEHDMMVLRSGKSQVFVEQNVEADGSITHWRSYKFPCLDADGSLLLGVVTVEVTEELRRAAEIEEANRLLRELATTDALTGLPNRRVFDERLELEFASARRKKRDLAVLMIDVDNFKSRNDTYGHEHGDNILRQLGKCLQNAVREGDLPARYGGEEFCVVLPECGEEQALEMCARIRECIRSEEWENGTITISIGAMGIDVTTPNAQRMVVLADEALYAAKRAGKDRAVGYHAYFAEMLAELQASTEKLQ